MPPSPGENAFARVGSCPNRVQPALSSPKRQATTGIFAIDQLCDRQIRKQIGQDYDVLLQVGAGWAKVWYIAYACVLFI